MIDKSKFIVILPSHGWTTKYIRESGYKVEDPYYGKSYLGRAIRWVWFKLNLPFQSFYYNRNLVMKDKIIFIFDSLITAKFLKWINKKCRNCNIILYFTNPVRDSKLPNEIGSNYCSMWTSDAEDAKKFGMNLYSGGGYFPQWKIRKEIPQYDVFYIGKDKGRLQKLQSIENEMKSYGINTYFYITWERGWQKAKDGIHQEFLPYEKVLEYIGKSKAILHLIEGAQQGITIRIQESLIHKRKLITDDKNITGYDFYNPHNIFILGVDELSQLREFLDSPYEDVKSDYFSHAYFDDMIEIVVNSVIENKI